LTIAIIGTNFFGRIQKPNVLYTPTPQKNQNSQICTKMKIKLNFKNFIIKIKPKETAIMVHSNPKAGLLLFRDMKTF